MHRCNARILPVIQMTLACLIELHIAMATGTLCSTGDKLCSHVVTPYVTNDSCLNNPIPCCDINTYIKNSSFLSSTVFCFLNGIHSINLVDSKMLMIENGSNITLIGLGSLESQQLNTKVQEYNFVSYEEDKDITFLQSSSIIQCTHSFALVFSNVSNLTLQNLRIQDCGADVKDWTAGIQGGVVFPYINKVAVLMVHVTDLLLEQISVQNSTGYGLVAINTSGRSRLNGSSFIGNNQQIKHSYLTSYIFRNFVCSDGTCHTSSTIYTSNASTVISGLLHPGGNAIFIFKHLPNVSQTPSLEIDSCLFTLGVDDSIPLGFFHPPMYNVPNFRVMGTGLGILWTQEYSVRINITNTASYRNQAWLGANFNIQEVHGSSVTAFVNVSSTRGISPFGGGTFYYSVDNPVLNIDTLSSAIFDGCILSPDCSSAAGSITVSEIKHFEMIGCQSFGQLIISGRNGNISVTNSVLQSVNCIGGIEVNLYNASITNCSFNGAGLVSLHNTVNITDSNFTDCQSTAISTYDGVLQFSGNVSLTNNKASSNGGALNIYHSNIVFLAPVNLVFLNNSAQEYGGAIFIQEDPRDPFCTLTFDDPTGTLDNPGVQIYIDYSHAGRAGNVLYGGNVEGCKFDCSTAPNYCVYGIYASLATIFDVTTELGSNNGNKSARISSDAIGVYYCVNGSVVPSYSQPIVSSYPGEELNIPIITVGQMWGASPDIVTNLRCNLNSDACTIPSYKPSDLQLTHQSCTNYTYQVQADRNITYHINIILTAAYSSNVGTASYQVTINVGQCPFGFGNFNSTDKICYPDDVLIKNNITADVRTLTVSRNGSTWVGNSFNMTAVHLCPYDYCVPWPVVFKIPDEQDKQCSNNRTGILCGQCKQNWSMVLGSTTCWECGDKYWWLLILFCLMGVALVAFIFLLNCTVSVGTINGLILYTNIFIAGIVTCSTDTRLRLFVPLSWLNLNLGIQTCFSSGMTMITKVWLQLVFPTYILLLVGTFIYACRWSSTLARLFRKNAVGVLATLVLLSYTTVLETVSTIVTPALFNLSENQPNNPPRWLADGNVLYARGSHLGLLMVGVVVLVAFIFPYTMILLLAPWIQERSHWKLLSWVNKLKPFLDVYQAPFKDRFRYWPGVLLMVRLVLYTVFIINNGGDRNMNLLAITLVLSLYTIVANRLSVYKSWPLGVLENYFVISLIFLSSSILYINDPSNCSSDVKLNLLQASAGITFFVMLGMIFYHLHIQLKGSTVLKRVSQKIGSHKSIDLHTEKSSLVTASKQFVVNYYECREPILEES